MELWCYGGRTVAMVTARARAPTMARVGGLAAGRGARRRAICCVAAPPEALTLRSLRSVRRDKANESSDGLKSSEMDSFTDTPFGCKSSYKSLPYPPG